MLRAWLLALVPCTAFAFVACGDDAGTGGSSSNTTAASPPVTGTGTGGGGPTNSGDCNGPADCPNGECVAVVPGGWRTCTVNPVLVTMCEGMGGGGGQGGGGGAPPSLDECCESDDCNDDGKCVQTPVFAECGGPQMQPYNVCDNDQDECNTSADCGGGLCAPRGAFGNKSRKCYPLNCATDGDCTAEAGGICAPISEPCCDTVVGLFCVYPNDCRNNADCAGMGFCQLSGQRASCAPGTPICPL